jgi:hypothetical protein
MADFSAASALLVAPDPDKRVKYSLGLVLGVDELDQEQFYFLERDRQHNRSLHGYGTICGLRVTINGTQVRVGAGLAANPQGKMIRVTREQCADVNDWLAVPSHQQALKEQLEGGLASPLGSPLPGPLPSARLYVVLCDRECETDKLPVAGAPCRSEEDNLAPSRITETFELRFSTRSPHAEEEQAVRAFGQLLRRLEVASGPAPVLTVAALEDLVRDLLAPGSPLGSPLASLLEGEPLRLPPDIADEALRAAFRVWVTEVRPALLADARNCGCGVPEERCILLAQLDFDVTADWRVGPTGSPVVQLDEKDRPYLVHTRLLQELILHSIDEIPLLGLGSPVEPAFAALGGDVTGGVANTTVERVRNVPVRAVVPSDGQFLRATTTGGTTVWEPADLPPAPPPVIPPLVGDVVTVASGNNELHAIQGTPVSGAAPGLGQVLSVTPDPTVPGGIRWQPADLPSAPPPVIPPLVGDVITLANGATELVRIQGTPVSAPPVPAVAQVLRTADVGGTVEWQAQALNVVEHPPLLPSYAIVAAGIVRDGSSRPPVYNNLSARLFSPTSPTPTQLLIQFDNYRPPDDTFTYIVKALPVLTEVFRGPIITFDRFLPEGILLDIRDLGQPSQNLSALELMIEISQFPFGL